MEALPDAERVGRLLRTTALRGFGPDADTNYGIPWGNGRRITIAWSDCPIPSVLKLGLSLIDLPVCGPGEKVAWWIPFAYDGHRYELTHQKFGLRLRLIDRDVDPGVVQELLLNVQAKLLAAMRIVEQSIRATSKTMIDAGAATVKNQHYQLQMTYEYFRDRALNPTTVEDEHTVFGELGGPDGFSSTFRSGSAVMELNATRDLSASVTAYFSRIEHDLVLALPFAGFDASSDHLT